MKPLPGESESNSGSHFLGFEQQSCHNSVHFYTARKFHPMITTRCFIVRCLRNIT